MQFVIRQVYLYDMNMKKEEKDSLEMRGERLEDATLNEEAALNEEASQEEQVDETPSVQQLEERIAELEDKNLRMMAEFDNYRRRTNKEKLELMATAGERIFKEMLPLVDDFERAADAMAKTDDIEAVLWSLLQAGTREGVIGYG